MPFDLAFALAIVPIVVGALRLTLVVTLLASALALGLGFALELIRRYVRVLRAPVGVAIDVIRSTPLLVQLYFLFYVLPYYGITLPAMVVGVLALGVYYSGYLAEVFKAGFDSVPRGQFQAAEALGLNFVQRTVWIIAPQMLRGVAAPAGGYVISLFKSTPYLAAIAVPEAFGAALDVSSDTFRYAEPMLVVGAVYLAIALVLSWLVGRAEARLSLKTRS